MLKLNQDFNPQRLSSLAALTWGLITIMFHSSQMLPDLKADNQRLKDENGALIRVISKLSK